MIRKQKAFNWVILLLTEVCTILTLPTPFISESSILLNVSVTLLSHGRKVGPSPGTPGPPGPPAPPGPLGPLETWEITFTVWNSEFKHPETLNWSINKDLPKLYNWIITNQSEKFCVPSEVILFIELLTMFIRGQSLSSSYVTVINRNDNQRHLIGYTWIEKISQFLTLQYVKISIKTPFFCYRWYTKEKKCFHYIRQINHGL